MTAKGISQNVFGVYETFMPKTHSFSKLLLCIGHKSIDFLGEKNDTPKTMNGIGIPNCNNLMLDSNKDRNSCSFIQQKLPAYYLFMYQKSK